MRTVSHLICTAAIIGASLVFSNMAHARGGHGHSIGDRSSSLPTYLVLDVVKASDMASVKAAIEKAGTSFGKFGGQIIVDSDHVTGQGAQASARLLIVEFSSSAHAKEWTESKEGKELEAAVQEAGEVRISLAEGMPRAFGGRPIGKNSEAFQRIMKERDEDLRRFKDICKGC